MAAVGIDFMSWGCTLRQLCKTMRPLGWKKNWSILHSYINKCLSNNTGVVLLLSRYIFWCRKCQWTWISRSMMTWQWEIWWHNDIKESDLHISTRLQTKSLSYTCIYGARHTTMKLKQQHITCCRRSALKVPWLPDWSFRWLLLSLDWSAWDLGILIANDTILWSAVSPANSCCGTYW